MLIGVAGLTTPWRTAMNQYVGVSQGQTSIRVVDGNGRVLWQGKSASTPDMMCIPTKSATDSNRKPAIVPIGYRPSPAADRSIVLISWDAGAVKLLSSPSCIGHPASTGVGLPMVLTLAQPYHAGPRLSLASTRSLCQIPPECRNFPECGDFHAPFSSGLRLSGSAARSRKARQVLAGCRLTIGRPGSLGFQAPGSIVSSNVNPTFEFAIE